MLTHMHEHTTKRIRPIYLELSVNQREIAGLLSRSLPLLLNVTRWTRSPVVSQDLMVVFLTFPLWSTLSCRFMSRQLQHFSGWWVLLCKAENRPAACSVGDSKWPNTFNRFQLQSRFKCDWHNMRSIFNWATITNLNLVYKDLIFLKQYFFFTFCP